MRAKFALRFCAVLVVLHITLIVSATAIALPINFDGKMIAAQFNPTQELTPRQRQQVQAIRQGRNRGLQAVLDTTQEQELSRYLRTGQSLESAVEKVDLSNEQREMVKALEKIYRLKLKALTYTSFK